MTHFYSVRAHGLPRASSQGVWGIRGKGRCAPSQLSLRGKFGTPLLVAEALPASGRPGPPSYTQYHCVVYQHQGSSGLTTKVRTAIKRRGKRRPQPPLSPPPLSTFLPSSPMILIFETLYFVHILMMCTCLLFRSMEGIYEKKFRLQQRAKMVGLLAECERGSRPLEANAALPPRPVRAVQQQSSRLPD